MNYRCVFMLFLSTAGASLLQGQSETAPVQTAELKLVEDLSAEAAGVAPAPNVLPAPAGPVGLGWRSRLEDWGLKTSLYWTGIASGNPIGGEKPGHATEVDDVFLVFDLDLQKLAGWKNTTMTVSFIDRAGTGLTNQYIHSQYNAQQTVGGQALFFYQMAVQRSFQNDRLLVKAGRFSASDDMNASPVYGRYVNNGFNGDIRNVLFDTQFSAYPFSTWAGYARYRISESVQLKSAVFQAWPDIFNQHNHGLDWSIHSGDGIVTMHQLAWSPNWKTGDAADALPGHYWVGGTYSPWKGYQQFLSSGKASNSYGFYVHGDQMVFAKDAASDRGTTVWSAAAYYPQQNIAIVPFQVNAGVIDQGRFARRPKDQLILGVIYGGFSRDYARTQLAAGKGNPTHEMVIEAGYRIQLTRRSFLQPDLQWIARPGGTGRVPNAVVVGAEMGFAF